MCSVPIAKRRAADEFFRACRAFLNCQQESPARRSIEAGQGGQFAIKIYQATSTPIVDRIFTE